MSMRDAIEFFNANRGRRFAVTSHPRPDGDAIGSVLGLVGILNKAGFDARPANLYPVPERLAFLVDPESVRPADSPDWVKDYDCLAVLDCGDWERLDPVNRAARGKLDIVNIDHHASSAGVGSVNWIEPEASSVGEMIVRLAQAAKWKLPPEAAQGLWVAILTDTGRFCNANTTAPALAAAKECVLRGANPNLAARHIYQSVNRRERVLESRAMTRMRFLADGRLAVSWLEWQDFVDADCGVECAQDMINILRDTAGVEVAIFLYELQPAPGNPTGVKASVRTVDPHNAIELVSKYNGGGHLRAAGCSINLPLETARRHIVDDALQLYFDNRTP